ncbi:GrpB family protein [Chloroflexi bacterium TSY]|nr:GrpB family protein [Chloroflexi bacterium TSY]
MLGLKSGTVKLYPYKIEWNELFLQEKNRLMSAIGNDILKIEHVGSTAILGIPAKPIIDIAVAVTNFEEATCCIQPLESIGYHFKGEYGIPRRHFFLKGEPTTHHLHMNEITSADWRQMLAFRDYLRNHPHIAQEYVMLKQNLAHRYANDRPAYTSAKSSFITTVLQKALPEATMKSGDQIIVRNYKADSTCYRWRTVTVEQISNTMITAVSPPGNTIHNVGGDWISPHAIRTFYWLDRPYNLLEVYNPDGSLVELYINIASPARIKGSEIHFTDYELDIVCSPGEEPRVVDQDEFAKAIKTFGYSTEFQNECWRNVEAALKLVRGWSINGYPG